MAIFAELNSAFVAVLTEQLLFNGVSTSTGQPAVQEAVRRSVERISGNPGHYPEFISLVNKQSTQEMSSLAAKYMNLTSDRLYALTASTPGAGVEEAASDIRRIAASVVSQDETPSPKGDKS